MCERIAGLLIVTATALAGTSGLAQAAQTFADTVTLIPVSGYPNGLSDGDFNGDGDLDLAVGRYTGGSVAVSLGLAGLDFEAVSTYPVGGQPIATESADLTGDGDPELLVANRNDDNVSVLVGGAGGSFGADIGPFAAGNGPDSLALADFNGDTLLDLAAADFFPGPTASILPGTGGGTFGAPSTISSGGNSRQPREIAAADFNGDGDPDLAIANQQDFPLFDPPSGGNVSIFLGSSGLSFASPTNHAVETPRGLTLADFDGDGRQDIATTRVEVLTGGPGGAFAPPQLAAEGALTIDTADFNRDGDPDLALTGTKAVTVLLGGPGSSFEEPVYLPAGFEPVSVETGDYNADGLPDIAIANQQSGDLYVYRNTGETGPGAAKCLGKKATIVGTDGKDKLRGTGRADVIAGLGGKDTLKGRGGKDRLCGGGGKDKIIGGGGKDKCAGGGAIDKERSCP